MAKSSDAEGDMSLKYILVGDQACGKSSLLLRFTNDSFNGSHAVTVGVEFGTKIIAVGDRSVRIQAWDTAGQEAFRSITRSFFRGAAVALILYDVSRKETFRHVENWLSDCRKNSTNDNMVIMLVGNKVDLAHKRRVSTSMGQDLADKHGAMFCEVSAKDNHQVEKVFFESASRVCELIDNSTITPPDYRNSGVTLRSKTNSQSGARARAGCC